MGNTFSTGSGSSSGNAGSSRAPPAAADAPQCYYELLGVAQDATPEELKKAYRQKALQLHPDKNLHRLEAAHHEFAAVRAAYDVLSDPQERAWYDRHRATILSRGRRAAAAAEDAPSLDDLLKFFDEGVYAGHGDDARGFFAVYRELFQFLEEFEAEEELAAGPACTSRPARTSRPAPLAYTTFGSKHTPYEPQLRQFYDKWLHFSSARTFDEADRYQPAYHDNRRLRRAMHKENSKERDRLRREFSETVRDLAAFVRKRDPRYAAHQRARTEDRRRQEEERRQREHARRQEEASGFVEQDWSRLDEEQLRRAFDEHLAGLDHDCGDVGGGGGSASEAEGAAELVIEEFYCAPCRKLFKNPAQWRNHAQSKKHKSKLASLGIPLEEEEDFYVGSLDEREGLGEREGLDESKQSPASPEIESEASVKRHGSARHKKPALRNVRAEASDQSGSEKSGSDQSGSELVESLSSLNLAPPAPEEPTVKKPKKSRRAKKSSSRTDDDLEYRCNVCRTAFASRNQLFKHVKDEGHALATPARK